MRALAALALLGTLLAGCSGEAPDEALPPTDFTELDLAATATTGIIRGVAVDEAVRPLAGVTIALQTEAGAKETKTTEDGIFGFEDLAAGTYFLAASKPGYFSAQTSVDVLAGVAEPPIAKVLMVADPVNRPYFDVLKWDGFIQCSTRFVVNALAACSVTGIVDPSLSEDNFTFRMLPGKVPAFAQSEMVWESTQALGDGMKVQYTDDREGLDNYVIAIGSSPLLISANETLLADHDVDGETGLLVRIFAGSVDGTTPPACPPGPCEGVSVVVNQSFTVYTVLFYGFTPPEGYRFSADGEPEVPA